MRLSSPGKLVLLGEYAVIEGGEAMVAAVDRRAHGTWTSEDVRWSPLIEALWEESDRARGAEHVQVDSTAFRDASGVKLGLGSSAAVAVVGAALIADARDETALSLAIRAHRRANGGGSGVDVAASFHGGVIAAHRQPGRVRPLPAQCPGLHLAVLYMGQAASTKAMVKACRSSPDWPRHAATLKQLATEGIDAWARQDATRFVLATRRYGQSMRALGRSANVDVVTEVMGEVMRMATDEGGAAKPSGAGGGDVMVVWSHDPELGVRLAESTDTSLLELAIDPQGLRVDR